MIKPTSSTSWWILGAGILIVFFHGVYLWKMFDNTIGDAHIQRWAEKKMYRLAFNKGIPKCERGFTKYPMYPKLSKYGIVQVCITAVLVIGAFAAVRADRTSAPTDPQKAAEVKK